MASYNLSEGVHLEYVGLRWNFTVSVLNSLYYRIDLRNSTRIIKSVANQDFIPINGSAFEGFKNPYQVFVYANNSFGARTGQVNFIMNDTTLPVCSGLLSINVSPEQDYVWDVNCSDQLFDSFNISCDNSFNFSRKNIGNTSYHFGNRTWVNVTDVICGYHYCDTRKNCVAGSQTLTTEAPLRGLAKWFNITGTENVLFVLGLIAFCCFMLIFSEIKGDTMFLRWMTFSFMLIISIMLFEVYIMFAYVWMVFSVTYLLRNVYLMLD
jgi:hypothetical protein